jgi:hypothetical protein
MNGAILENSDLKEEKKNQERIFIKLVRQVFEQIWFIESLKNFCNPSITD